MEIVSYLRQSDSQIVYGTVPLRQSDNQTTYGTGPVGSYCQTVT